MSMEGSGIVNIREKIVISAPLKSPKRFIELLYNILEDESNSELISWSADGQSFILEGQAEALEKLLSKYFSHSKYTSFVRQLSFYGFKKNTQTRAYHHPTFCRGGENLLGSIKRTKTLKESPLTNGPKESLVNRMQASLSAHRDEVFLRPLLSELEILYRNISKLRSENNDLMRVFERMNVRGDRDIRNNGHLHERGPEATRNITNLIPLNLSQHYFNPLHQDYRERYATHIHDEEEIERNSSVLIMGNNSSQAMARDYSHDSSPLQFDDQLSSQERLYTQDPVSNNTSQNRTSINDIEDFFTQGGESNSKII